MLFCVVAPNPIGHISKRVKFTIANDEYVYYLTYVSLKLSISYESYKL